MTVVRKSREMPGAPRYFKIITGRNFNLAVGII